MSNSDIVPQNKRTFFVECDPSYLLVTDAIEELRQQKRLIFPAEGYNEASPNGDNSIRSTTNGTTWGKVYDFVRTAHCVMRSYMLSACDLSNYDNKKYDAKPNNINLVRMGTTINHQFRPAATEMEAVQLKCEFDRLFPIWLIEYKINEAEMQSLAQFRFNELTLVEWTRENGLAAFHRIQCTPNIKREAENVYIAKPHVTYYRIGVEGTKERDGDRCKFLLDLLNRHTDQEEALVAKAQKDDKGVEDSETNRDNEDDEKDSVNDISQALAQSTLNSQ